MKKYLELIRIKHWIKNILVFIPLISSGLFNINNIINCILCFFSFSFMTSFIYILNDIKDIEKDKLHPRKKNRPLASNKISISTAIYISIIMLLLSIIFNILVKNNILNISLYLLITYMILNIGYSFGLKNIAIVDIVILTAGFVLRVYYGASIINVPVSSWLFSSILCASLFLIFGKRRKEYIHNKDTRKVLKEYSEEFLNKFQYISLTLMFAFYSLWCIEKDINYLIFTLPLLLLIFMKYSLNIEKGTEGDPITILYHDKSLLLLSIIYAIMMFIIMLF